MFEYSIVCCIIGFVADFIFGDPNFSYHPIRLMGKLIEIGEKNFVKIFKNKFIAGIFIVLFVCIVSVLTVFFILLLCYKINLYFGILAESIICYFMIAAKSLKTESMKVYEKLESSSLKESQKAVSMIVGRDTDNLTKEGVIKATVETVAENFSDGVVAPMFYMFIGGALLGVLYKCINTCDSMVGYKDEKYIMIGKFAARLDDVVNFIPSRISAVMLIFSSLILRKNFKNAIKIFKRDRYKHSSPNAGQTESVCAGALEIQLAGNAYYFGKLYEKPFIGDELSKINPKHIVEINKMMYASAILMVFLVMVIYIGGLIIW